MCRWFAYISGSEDCLLKDVLIKPDHSLLKQVNGNYLRGIVIPRPQLKGILVDEPSRRAFDNWLNVDGFGMVWYTPRFSEFTPPQAGGVQKLHPAQYHPRPTCSTNVGENHFAGAVGTDGEKVRVVDRRLDGSVAVNNHPFIFGIHTFMHNGLISSFEGDVKRKIIALISHEAYGHIKGTTDSEHFAALFMTYLCQSNPMASTSVTQNPDPTPAAKAKIPAAWEEFHTAEEMKEALLKTIKAIIDIQKDVLGEEVLSNFFNIAVTDGKDLVACRFRNHEQLKPTSLYYSTTAGPTLNSRYPRDLDGKECTGCGLRPSKPNEEGAKKHKPHVIIASEPSTRDLNEWSKLRKNHMLLAKGGDELTIEAMHVELNVTKDSFQLGTVVIADGIHDFPSHSIFA